VYGECFERFVIYRYLDCGILRNGFARVPCGECGHEYLVAFSYERRHFCPSSHQKIAAEFDEWVCGEVLKKGPYRHPVFSIPKILRRYFSGPRLPDGFIGKLIGKWTFGGRNGLVCPQEKLMTRS
jgi:hypothetical protein